MEPSKLPKLDKAAAQKPELQIVANLSSLFAAVPWGAPLPTIQFNSWGAAPAFIHTLVGDVVWKSCWGDKHGGITGEHFVPYKMVNVVKNIIEQLELQPGAEDLAAGQQRYAEALRLAEQRRKRGSPY